MAGLFLPGTQLAVAALPGGTGDAAVLAAHERAREREREAGGRRRRWSRGRKRVGSGGGGEDMAETIVSWGRGGGEAHGAPRV